ncbi:hypothetical protein [Pengzhenrongella frigida]|uniref:Tetratricopeptide repeat protein n=1 Tax=Pengzhenrongella frigida TaxID=1259133 RepID=A0A4Q5N2N7_9MICO|nr:hypothetical protein [Cellulomonas sp. HLT2-17]RYV52429.1 hypothetical protein EUA98_02910 [Cellulomonas sp. HLT2-17]
MTAIRRRWLPRLGAMALTGLLGLYVALVASRAVALMRTGEPVGVALGVAFLVLPVIAIWFVVREWRLAVAGQRMADELAGQGELQVDDLPRSPSGRIDRAAARVAFEDVRREAEANRGDWAAWYRLAFAYDAAGDRKRAREALRRAAGLHRAG